MAQLSDTSLIKEIFGLANTEAGKYLLGVGSKEEIFKITPNSVHLIKGLSKNKLIVQATFYGSNFVAETFCPILDKIRIANEYERIKNKNEAFLHFSGLETKNYKYPQIFLTTDTFNPAAGTNTPVDGDVWWNNTDSLWAGMQGATAGNYVQTTSTSMYVCYLKASGAGSPYWSYLIRSFTLFDTSSLTASAEISSAVESLYLSSADNDPNMGQSVYLVTTTPANTNNLVNEDFDQVGSVSQANTPLISALSASAYNDWTLNATGRGNISKTGITKFGFRISGDATNTEPSWPGGNLDNTVIANSADNASNKPKLVVTYTTTSIKKVAGVAYASIKKIGGVAIASVKKVGGVA